MLRRTLLVLAALLMLGAASAEEPTQESVLDQVLSSSQIYCKVEVFGPHPVRTLCYAEKVLLDVGIFDFSVATRYDITPYGAITPMLMSQVMGENWFMQIHLGHTVWGHGGGYFSFTGGITFE